MIATIDPSTFQTTALAWLSVITAIAGAAITAVVLLLPRLATVIQSVRDLTGRVDRQHDRIAATQQQVVDVARQVSPVSATPAPVQVVNTPANPVPVDEAK
jgi:hypothetical protein